MPHMGLDRDQAVVGGGVWDHAGRVRRADVAQSVPLIGRGVRKVAHGVPPAGEGAGQGSPVAANRVEFLAAKRTGRKGPPRAAEYRRNPRAAALLAFSACVGADEARLGLVEALAVRAAGKGGRSPLVTGGL